MKGSKFGHVKGGLTIYSSIKTITATEDVDTFTSSTNAIKALRVSIRDRNTTQQTLLLNTYIDPRNKIKGVKIVEAEIIRLLSEEPTSNLLLTGDFNMHLTGPQTRDELLEEQHIA